MFKRNILDYLEQWSKKEGRKPLVLRGARQVGKTFAVVSFAEQHFENFFHINLEKAEHYELFKETNSVTEFEKIADIIFKQKLIPGKTLVFIDEIQNTPKLIALLRFFYEERPNLHVIAAGSLLEVKIKKEGLSLPVGRVEYVYVHPLTFFEFLGAVGETKMLEFLKKVTLKKAIPIAIHRRALQLFFEYALIGGMPEVVALFVRKSSQEDLNSLYASLLTAYSEDIYKYASSAQVKYLRHVLEQAPYFAGERISYEKFGGSAFRSREMGEAFDILEKTMIVRQIKATKSVSMPIVAQRKRAKKLLYLDSGFVNFKNNIQAQYLKLTDLSDLYRGKIAEQIVGQNILAGQLHQEQDLFYWAKEKPGAEAEVDFCVVQQGKIIGIEVKSGKAARMKSLASFAQSVENSKLVRIYSGEMRNEPLTVAGKKYQFVSLPFYLVNRIFDFC